MTIKLRPLQAITNAPENYDYGWMKTVVDNVAVDERGRSCRLVQNDDEWHFRQQLLRYGSGLNLVISDQKQLDDFLRHGWLKLTDTPVRIHRIKLDLHQALGWRDERRDALLECLDQWRDGPQIKYSTGHNCDYYLECRGDDAAEQVRAKLREFGLSFEPWGPQPDAVLQPA
ncbi:MAG: hypothetical protein GXX96_35620 [Planctomycetaceae bacterium]|nr:hypothetical protein [Planctomycetaceae bacterium]